GANAQVSPSDVDENAEAIGEAGAVLAQLEIPFETVRHLGKICARLNVPLILDPAPARSLPAELLEQVAWLTPNQTEIVQCLLDRPRSEEPFEMVEALVKRVGCGVVLKMGSRGAYLATRSGIRQQFDAFRVKAIDTTAAGDAFNGAFAVALMMSKTPIASAR